MLRVRVLGDGEAIEAAARPLRRRARVVASAAILDDGQIELGFRGDDADVGRPARAARSAPGSGSPSFARAASDLEELFLQVTSGNAREAVA